MRATLIVVACVVVAGLGVAAWLLVAPTQTTAPDAARPVSTSGPSVGAPAVEGSEVLPPQQTAQQPDRLPPREPVAPRVSLPLPESGSADGELIIGFPSDLAAPMGDSDVIDSTVATEGGVMQFTLRARTDASADAVLAHYRELWASMGLAPASTEQTDGASYGDTYSTVTVVAESGGTGVVYSIFGVLRAA